MRRIALLAMTGVLLAALTGCGNSANAANTEYIYGQIDSVSGNDIVLLLADYHENADSGSADAGQEKPSDDSDSEKTKRQRPENGEMPEGFDPSQFGGQMPGGFSRSKDGGESEDSGSERKRPDKGNMPEGFDPENFDPSQFGGQMPGGFSRSKDGEGAEGADTSKTGRKKSGNSKYTLTGEQEELRIPVGTTVTTAAGVETNFDVLKPGDYIKCSVETDSDGNTVITAVQIMEA